MEKLYSCTFSGLCVVLCIGLISCDTHRYVGGSYDTRYSDMGYDRGYLSDWNSDWPMNGGGGRLNLQPKCVDIPSNLTLCRNIGYTRMRLPNLLDHDSLKEVTNQAGPWVPLLGIACHPNTKLFLCSLFSPVCLDRPIYPCKSLCEEVQAGCEDRMMRYGYGWPEMLRCDKFPPDNDLCIGTQTSSQAVDDNVCAECNQPDTFESIIDNYCSADFVLRVKVSDKVISGDQTIVRVAKKKKKVYKKGSMNRRYFRDPELVIKNGASCDCPVIDPSRKKDTYLVMGKLREGKMVMTYAALIERGSKVQRRAFKEIRSEDTLICKSSLTELAQIMGDDGKVVGGTPDKPRKADRKGKKDRRKKQRKPKGNSEGSADERREQRRKARRERKKGATSTEQPTLF